MAMNSNQKCKRPSDELTPEVNLYREKKKWVKMGKIESVPMPNTIFMVLKTTGLSLKELIKDSL